MCVLAPEELPFGIYQVNSTWYAFVLAFTLLYMQAPSDLIFTPQRPFTSSRGVPQIGTPSVSARVCAQP